MMYSCGKGKDDDLTGEITIPEKSDCKYKTWNAESNMVMPWLINSMNNEIGENFLLYKTVGDI